MTNDDAFLSVRKEGVILIYLLLNVWQTGADKLSKFPNWKLIEKTIVF